MFEVKVNGKVWFKYETREEAEKKKLEIERHCLAKVTIEQIWIRGRAHV